MSQRFATGALCAVVAVLPLRAFADPGPCTSAFDATTAVACAREASPAVRRAREELKVVAARRRGAAVMLPSRPTISASAAFRTTGAASDGNAYLSLSQDLELGDRRGLRLAENDAEEAVARAELAVAAHETAAEVLVALVEATAASEFAVLARAVRDDAHVLATDARRRVAASLLAPVDARVAELDLIRAEVTLLDATYAAAAALRRLAFLTGSPALDPAGPPPLGDLLRQLTRPDLAGLEELAASRRPEVVRVQAEVMRWAASARLLRAAVQPTLSPFVMLQRDGLGEYVFGGGLALPLPVGPDLAPDRSAEAAEAEARVAQARVEEEAALRRVRNQAGEAVKRVEATARQAALFTSDLRTGTAGTLEQLRTQSSEGRLALRDALILRRTLVDVSQQAHQANLANALAHVELIRATAAGWPGESR